MNLLFIIGVIVLSIGLSEAVKCYKCSSATTGNCVVDPFEKSGVPICEGAVCLKALGSSTGITGVTRDCYNTKVPYVNTCGTTSKGYAESTMCFCDSDYCNDGRILQPSNMVLAVVASTTLAVLTRMIRV